jgi:hypothetical protein
MTFEPDNRIVQLCAEGISLEGRGDVDAASALFLQAWTEATNDFEKFTAAHYVARHQKTIEEKLKWDQIALDFALKIPGGVMKTYYPSLYLNIAKGHEDLGELQSAKKQYEIASSYLGFLPGDGYGKMISAGVHKGLERVG